MRLSLAGGLGWCFFVCGILLTGPLGRGAAADETTSLQSDHEFVLAAARGDAATAGKFLEAEFTWTDATGRTITRAQVLNAMPNPALGSEEGLNQMRQLFGQTNAVMTNRDRIHVLRIWVKRSGAWRLLVYHEVALGEQSAGGPDSGSRDCENPCRTVPYKPKSEAEQAVVASWEALETAVAAHDASAWAPHIANEFTMLGSTNEHALTKTDRISTLNLQKQTGRGALPPPVVSMQMFEFGDSLVMTSVHQPVTGKPLRVSRLWVKRDGKWVMSLSYQTTIRAAAAKSG